MDERRIARVTPPALIMVLLLALGLAANASAATTFTVNETGDQGDANTADGHCDRDAGTVGDQCTLRAAIQQANATGGADTINFQLVAPATIAVTSALPSITEQTTIDGGLSGVTVDGNGTPANVDGLVFTNTAGASVVQKLTIERFSRDGIVLNGTQAVTIKSNSIGADSFNPALGKGNGRNGIRLSNGASMTTIGGNPQTFDGNTIGGNGGDGILIDSASSVNTVADNGIGSDVGGLRALPNGGVGVRVLGPNNIIGQPGQGNVIDNNGDDGVLISGSAAKFNVLRGNTIGLDSSGRVAPNGRLGVDIEFSAATNTVGTTEAGGGNTISGNADGGMFISTSNGNTIQGNRVGTDPSGAALRPNGGEGIHVDLSVGNVIGGSAAGAGNVISGNLATGLFVENGASHDNVIQGNRIGTNAAGTLALPNQQGVRVNGAETVGGSGPGQGNLVSGNLDQGIETDTNSVVQGNLIGTNAAGTGAIPNGGEGIDVGGAGATIGGGGSAANTVAFNLGPGIRLETGGSVVAENSVFSNGGLGIDADPAGVTPGSAQPLPTVTAALASGGQTEVRGTATGGAGSTLTLRFFSSPDCDPSGFGEGRTPLGATTVTANGSGQAGFDVTLPAATGIGQQVTATATGPGGTSEFSACRAATAPPPPAAPAVRPIVSSLSQSTARWRLGSALAKLTRKAKPPVGTTFTFRLNEAASVRLDFVQRTTGRRVGRRCVAQTRANRRRPSCTRNVAAGSLTLTGHSGTNRVKFQGRLSRTRRLKPGSYRVTVTATASRLRSAARSLAFTIVKG